MASSFIAFIAVVAARLFHARTRPVVKHLVPLRQRTLKNIYTFFLAVLKAKIQIKNLSIRAGIGPKPTISLGQWQSGPSPGTPRAKEKIKIILSTARF